MILVAIFLITMYIVVNKWLKGHTMDKFISAGLKRKTDRILFATVILICALFSKKELPGRTGSLLLVSCLGIALWDHSQIMHYYAAFGITFVVAYLIISNARDRIDMLFIYLCILVVTILVLAGFEKKFDRFISQCEHFAFLVAAIYFIRKKIINHPIK